MSSTAPVVHIDEFRSRRSSRAAAPHLQEEWSPNESDEPSRRIGAGRSPARVVRSPRPRPVRACRRAVVPRESSPVPVTLTRRGRIAVLAMTLVFLAAGVLCSVALVQGASTADAERGQTVRTRTVTVEPGQTLWEIAVRVDPDADIRATVEEISRLNGLTSAGDLEMGQSLVVPVRPRG